MIDIEQSEQGGVVVLSPTGRLTLVSAPQLKKRVDQLVGSGHSRIVVDLDAVSYIDSSGLGALIGGLKRARQSGGDLRIAGAQGQAEAALHLTNLDRILGPYATVEDALDDW